MNKAKLHLDLHTDTSGKHYANALYGEIDKILDKWHKYEQKWRLYRFFNYFSSKVYGQMNHRIRFIKWPQKEPIVFPYIMLICTISLGLYILFKYRNKFMPRKQPTKDTVLVYGLAPAKTVPTISPFTLKLETYLRMAGIPYEIDMSGIQSSEGKNPWITYNGQDVNDSQECINFLNKKKDINLNQHLNLSDIAVSKAFRILIDEELSWPLALNCFVYDPINYLTDQLLCPAWAKYMFMALGVTLIRCKIKSRAKDLGLFQRGQEYVNGQASTVLDSLSIFLGNKPYFMGEKPSEVDASLFGMVGEYLYTAPADGPIRPKFNTDWTNLSEFCNRMKENYWPDWEQRITTGKNGQLQSSNIGN